MAFSTPCAALENDQISAPTDDERGEAAAHAAKLARASNEHIPPDDHAAAELASAYMIERSDAKKNNPQEENGAVLLQEEAVVGPSLSSLDPSPDVNKGTALEKGAASDLPRFSMDRSSDAINNAVAKGIASFLGPVMNHFDSGVEGALKSQSILATSIDRLTRVCTMDLILKSETPPAVSKSARNSETPFFAVSVSSVSETPWNYARNIALRSERERERERERIFAELDKLLEDVPLPFATHHATRLSGIRKRVLTLNTNLRIIQRRMETIQRFLAGYASKAVAKGNQERFSMENSNSVPHGPSPQGDAPCEAISTSTADADKQEDGGLSIHSEIWSQEQHNDPGA